jgi:hypothetical protein
MCCIAEIIVSIYGIVVLFTGKIAIGAGRYCYGTPARLAGGIFTATFPLAFLAVFLYGAVAGANAANSGQALDVQQIQVIGTGINIGVFLVCLIGGLVVAFANSEPKRKPRRFDYDDDYDRKFDSSRRRNRDEDRSGEKPSRPDDSGDPPDDRIVPE